MSQHLIFDFADTIAAKSPSPAAIVADFIKEQTGLVVPLVLIKRAYKYLDAIMPYSSVMIRTKADRTLFYENYNGMLLGLLGVTHKVSGYQMHKIFNIRESEWQIKPEAVVLMKKCCAEGWRIGIVSNFDSGLKDILSQEPSIGGLVNDIIVSQDEGLEKPDPELFHLFINRYGVDTSQSIYIGDSYHLDYLPSTQAGLTSYLLDETNSYSYLPFAIRNLQVLSSYIL